MKRRGLEDRPKKESMKKKEPLHIARIVASRYALGITFMKTKTAKQFAGVVIEKLKWGNNKMPNLYNITNEYKEIYNQLIESIDYETGEVDTILSNALDVKGQEFEVKALNTASVIKMLEDEQAKYEAEIKRLTDEKDKIKNAVTEAKTRVKDACLLLGFKKIDGVNSSISFRQSVKTIIDNLDELPDEYKKRTVKVEADLTKIKKAIQSGETINGAHLEENENLQIK